jgi:hypothetical protein
MMMLMPMPIPIPMGMMQRIPRLGRARHDRLEARRERAVGGSGSGSVIAGGLQLGRADARLVEEVGEVADAGAARVGVARDGAGVMVVLVMGWGGLGGALLLVARKGGGLGVAPAAG